MTAAATAETAAETAAARPSAPPAAAPRSPYLVSPAYDWAFFLLPPLLAFLVGAVIAGTPFSEKRFWHDGRKITSAALLSSVLTHAHLVAVFWRSHGNADLRRRYPLRFFVAPPLLFAATMLSDTVALCTTIVVVFWDVYHSALQTFGLARIYDRNRGNPPEQGRKLDLWLNHLLYAGPILGGATMLDHFRALESFEDVGATLFATIPAHMEARHRVITGIVLAAGTLFLAGYLLSYVRLHQRGYRVSPQKVFLLVTTGLCSLFAWGFNSFGQAFLIMNLFHAVQYLALVWWSEGTRFRKHLRLDGLRIGAPITIALFLGSALAYGVLAEKAQVEQRALWCMAQTVAIMHFWYDGFIWSVRRREV
ncbi:hypothetical protein [Chondromyces apiculatus]|uniref:Transmembrane protein n=1 Tax=Chondromyces apiculatus DSM 436 TaxID=1192034 RepID=A0A017T4W5_9BACT|nr:hypothetical protein [Chondromyces apiculatus]EYF04279.1 Hypothetical protein CAP_4756 [Chondromyces apiculatus DSM 436]